MNSPQPARSRESERLASILILQRKARSAATVEELGFLLVNDTSLILPYRTALFWRSRERRLQAVSGLPQPDGDAPFVRWANRLCAHLAAGGDRIRAFRRNDLPGALAADWGEFMPLNALWLPLAVPRAMGASQGGLLLAREEAWSEAEVRLLQHWVEAAAICLAASGRRRHAPAGWSRWKLAAAVAVLAALVAASFLEVRLSLLAPAEVVPSRPVMVRASLAGVIDRVEVEPNQAVRAGDLLFTLDDRELLSRLDVARQGLAIATAEYRQAAQAAISSREAQLQASLLGARIEQRQAEVEYVESLLRRVSVRAEQDGVLIFPDATGLRGRPVALGERVMQLADPDDLLLEAWIGTADSLPLEIGAPVDFFLNIDPEHPVEAVLKRVNYQAVQAPEGELAFRAEAVPVPGSRPLRIGLRGTAKLYGAPAPIYYYVLRRPLAAARQWLGL